MQLTFDQKETVKQILNFIFTPDEKYFCILGHGGTGKTILIKYLIEAIYNKQRLLKLINNSTLNYNIQITATTNAAVNVLNNLIPDYTCTTIYSFLNLTLKNNYQNGFKELNLSTHEIKNDYIIFIDEASMIDYKLLKLIDKLTKNCKIIFIGDPYQLAPVKQLVPIFDTLNCPKIYLKTVKRHSNEISKISKQCRDMVKYNKFFKLKSSNKVISTTGKQFKKAINFYYSNPKNLKLKVLTWTNQKTIAYNNYIRHLKNYPEDFIIGETVILNNPINNINFHRNIDSAVVITDSKTIDYYNDPKIQVKEITLDGTYTSYYFSDYLQRKYLLQQFAKLKDWPKYFEIKDNFLDLRASYATTVFKAQGHEYDIVFIDLADIGRCNIASTVRRMLYVALSRAKQKVFLYDQLPKKYQGESYE